MRKFIKEFRQFILDRGNVMDMAVGLIIGSAFTAIVSSLIKDIINPLIAALTTKADSDAPALSIRVLNSNQYINFSPFIGSVINFLMTALVVFMLIKLVNKSKEAAEKLAAATLLKEEEGDEVPAQPTCPYCTQDIPQGALRCPHCTSILPEATKEDIEHMEGISEPKSDSKSSANSTNTKSQETPSSSN